MRHSLTMKSLLAVAAMLAGTTFGGVSLVTITASNENGTSTFELTTDDLGIDEIGNEFSYRSGSSVELVDSTTNQVVATLDSFTLEYAGNSDGLRAGSSIVSLAFAVQAGSNTTNFTVRSALNNTFDPIQNPEGLASAGITLVDSNGNGGTLTGLHADDAGAPRVYRAEYNGLVPTGTAFTKLISGLTAAPGTQSVSTSENYPGSGLASVGAPVSDMSAEFYFSLSAFDLASGTSYYELVPEPASLSLLALGLVLFARRSR